MADINQFGSVRPVRSADAKQCLPFEAMLTEAIDGSLPAEDQAAFDLHLVGCASCREMLEEARRGVAWMEMLREHAPEPPAGMLERILAKTSGAVAVADGSVAALASAGLAVAGMPGSLEGAGVPASATAKVLPFPRRMAQRFAGLRAASHSLMQPRLAMTAAMAFFSVALTLNLMGVRLSDLRASDLKPSSMKRSLYEANAHVVRYYTNLRVVYELESRVHDLQRSSEEEQPQQPAVKREPAATEPAGRTPGSSEKKQQQPEQQPQRRQPNQPTSRREPIFEERRLLAERDGGPATMTDGRCVRARVLTDEAEIPQGRRLV